ncbi:uncharacterized protein LOC143177186 isoform X2 [Calliopsis andreniformis]|uniref:uncharacterized protein LOC143177186 isoform X2 n=1 Tax=Calliopsis andreniformis TaxID=337506 RepID=UPI003FCDD811
MGNLTVSKEFDCRTWLEALVAKIPESLGKEFTNASYDISSPTDCFFVSTMFFVNLTANSSSENEEKKTVSMVVKKPSMTEDTRELVRSDFQFHNEILFYNRFAKYHENLPRCIYSEEKPPTDSVIILENISHRGYELCQYKYRVPLEYIVAAIQEIARFHTKGYVMKERNKEEFFDFVRDLLEVRYDLDPENRLKVVTNLATSRGVDYLRDQGYDRDFCEKVHTKFENAYQNVVLPAVEPEEPLATLCHGDFTLNNTFFKREGGKLKTMFIDFALTRYGSPVIDLSTFLCLHCAEELDKDMLDSLLKAYHDALKQSLMENGMSDCEKYSYEALYEDYKRRGLFGKPREVGFSDMSFLVFMKEEIDLETNLPRESVSH